MVQSLICPTRGNWRKPSTAEVTEIGGVIIPSASKAAPPIMAGNTSHLLSSYQGIQRKNSSFTPVICFQGENNIFYSCL